MGELRVMLVGTFTPGWLESSYGSAFEEAGCTVRRFDLADAERRHTRLGAAGALFGSFVPVEPWTRKANRELVVTARAFRPDVLVVVGQNRVLPGAVAQIRSMQPVSTVFIWPDTLLNVPQHAIAALPLYDLVATYGEHTIDSFRRLGARDVRWVPLAGDPALHPREAPIPEYRCDVSFVATWRPEREAAMALALESVPGSTVKIWGEEWGRRCRNAAVRRAWQQRPLSGRAFSQAIASSKVSLNVIDETNYPAANMRFFEIPCAGGVEIASSCPEMAREFRHGESILYYDALEELPGVLRLALGDDGLRERIARRAAALVMDAHTYVHRARTILALVDAGRRGGSPEARPPLLTGDSGEGGRSAP